MEKTLTLGKIEGKRRRGWQRMRWLGSITHSTDVNLSKLQETVEDRGVWGVAVHGVAKSQTRHSDCIATVILILITNVMVKSGDFSVIFSPAFIS